MAWLKKKREKAVINFIDIDKELMSIRESVELSGKSNDPIEYDPTNDIKDLEGKGYVLVKNNFNGDGSQPSYTEDTKVYLISFKHDVRPVNLDHPLTKIPSKEYDHPITFTVTYEGTPTKVKKNIQTAHLFRTLTADKVTSQRIENGKYDSDWQLDRQKFDDVKVPVLPGVHADQKIVVWPKVDNKDVEVSVTYHLNGYLIPVDENGDEIPNVGPYQFATDEKDPTKIAPNQIVPDIEGYTHDQEIISPQSPDKDISIIYKTIPKEDTTYISDTENIDLSQADSSTYSPSGNGDLKENDVQEAIMGIKGQVDEKEMERRIDEQMAIVNFIDLDDDGKQITSSGPLYGLPGESINDLYNTDVPMTALKEAGFEVVFNNFDGNGQVQTFNQNHLVTQIFTVGLRHINSKEKNESSNSLQAFSQQQGEVLKKLENYQSTGNSKDLETITAVAKDTIEVLNKFLEKNQTVENTKNSTTKK